MKTKKPKKLTKKQRRFCLVVILANSPELLVMAGLGHIPLGLIAEALIP